MQEAAVVPPNVALAVRTSPGFWEFVTVNAVSLGVEDLTASEYLKFKEAIFDENWLVLSLQIVLLHWVMGSNFEL